MICKEKVCRVARRRGRSKIGFRLRAVYPTSSDKRKDNRGLKRFNKGKYTCKFSHCQEICACKQDYVRHTIYIHFSQDTLPSSSGAELHRNISLKKLASR